MPRAFNLTRPGILYRHEAFDAGLKACGYTVTHGVPPRFSPDDVVVGWNRYGATLDIATRVENAGGVYLAAENGYLGPGGVSPHQMHPRQWFALARGWHNDSQVIPTGGPERFNALGVDLKPWRTAGNHILILPNRSFGAPGRAMPPDWPLTVRTRLRELTKREIRVRPHPGNDAPRKPLADDLAGAWCTVIWSSSAGVHALVAGVPVICESPKWICKQSSMKFSELETLDSRETAPDASVQFCEYYERLRQRSMECLAWGQWSLAEIADGTAFRAVLTPETVAA